MRPQPATPPCSRCGLRHFVGTNCEAAEQAARQPTLHDDDETLPACLRCGLNHPPLLCEVALCKQYNRMVIWVRDARRVDLMMETWSECVDEARRAAETTARLEFALDRMRRGIVVSHDGGA